MGKNLSSEKGQRQVVIPYVGLSPQEVVLKRKKTVGMVVRERIHMGEKKDIEGFTENSPHNGDLKHFPHQFLLAHQGQMLAS